MVTEDVKATALAEHLNLEQGTDYILDLGCNEYSYGSEHYLVLTDSEADEMWEDQLSGYLNECVLPQIPDYLQQYFDESSWFEDAKMDGRGHMLANYDGNEWEEYIDGTFYYIYRIQ